VERANKRGEAWAIMIGKLCDSGSCISFTLREEPVVSIEDIAAEVELQIELMELAEEGATENEDEDDDI
jgi:hypothetical protein